MKINPPWYFECGWWSPWCFLDEHLHRIFKDSHPDGCGDLPGPLKAVCRKHDQAAADHYYRKHPEHAEEDGR